MKVFISWSGERSGQVADSLCRWLPRVIQAVKPWMSAASIEPGVRWSDDLAKVLAETDFGILCLTLENLTEPWILFEAGALSKTVAKSRVIPYLLGFEPRELKGPLSQYQAVRADEAGTLKLVTAVNNGLATPILSLEDLAESFQLRWPKLQSDLDAATKVAVKKPPPPERTEKDLLGEVLELLRAKSASSGTGLGSSKYLTETQPKTMAKTVGEGIRSHRLQKKLTEEELGKLVGITAEEITRFEHGKSLPGRLVLYQLADVLGTTPFHLQLAVLPSTPANP